MSKLPWFYKIAMRMMDEVEDDSYLGDVCELYQIRFMKSRWSAWWWLLVQTMRSVPALFAYRVLWRWIMLKNDFMVSLRQLKRQSFVAGINILGLGLGLALVLLALLYLHFEWNHDRFHEDRERIYRLVTELEDPYMGKDKMPISPPTLAPLLPEHFPEITHAASCRIKNAWVNVENEEVKEGKILYTDRSFFDIFSFPILQGEAALEAPGTMLISESLVRKYFENGDAVGQTLKVRNKLFQVVGIFKDIPENSHIHFDFVTSIETYFQEQAVVRSEAWDNWSYVTYFKVAPDVDLSKFIDYFESELVKLEPARENDEEREESFFAQNLLDIHFYTDSVFESEPRTDVKRLMLYATIALSVLLIACFNYINLSTARSTLRAKEIGMRKVVGASRLLITRQIFTETVVTMALALLVSVMLFILLLQPFSNYLELNLSHYLMSNLWLLGLLLGVFVVTTGLAGFYPAWIVSSFRPIQIFRRWAVNGSEASRRFRNLLVLLQFTFTLIFIFVTLVTRKQYHYMMQYDNGYNEAGVIRLYDPVLQTHYEAFKNDLLQNAEIIDVSSSQQPINHIDNGSFGSWGDMGEREAELFYTQSVAFNYFSFYGLKFAEGRPFERFEQRTQKKFIVNEAALRLMGWDHAAGGQFKLGDGEEWGEIIGVVKDFHFQSLHLPVAPLVIMHQEDCGGEVEIRFNGGAFDESLAVVERAWDKLPTGRRFEPKFLDEDLASMYRQEKKYFQSFMVFSVLAISIAGMGLAGLAVFAAQRRQKEMGIRKVLGASVKQLFMLFSMDLLKKMILAIFIAWPAGLWLSRSWLENFAYRIKITPDLYAVSALLGLGILFLAIAWQAWMSARLKPAATLRAE